MSRQGNWGGATLSVFGRSVYGALGRGFSLVKYVHMPGAPGKDFPYFPVCPPFCLGVMQSSRPHVGPQDGKG